MNEQSDGQQFHIQRIKKITQDDTFYRTIGIMYSLVIFTLLGGFLLSGIGTEPPFSGSIKIKWDLIPPVITLLFMAITCYHFYTTIVILVVESLWGKLTSLLLALMFWGCCILTLSEPLLWVWFVAGSILVISIKSLYVYFRLRYQKRVLRWKENHPLQKKFLRWSIISFGYAVFTGLIGIIASFVLKSTLSDLDKWVTNIIIPGLILFFCAKILHNFSKAGHSKPSEIDQIEQAIEEFYNNPGTPYN